MHNVGDDKSKQVSSASVALSKSKATKRNRSTRYGSLVPDLILQIESLDLQLCELQCKVRLADRHVVEKLRLKFKERDVKFRESSGSSSKLVNQLSPSHDKE